MSTENDDTVPMPSSGLGDWAKVAVFSVGAAVAVLLTVAAIFLGADTLTGAVLDVLPQTWPWWD